MLVYRNYDQATLDAQYTQSTLVPNIADYRKRWVEASRHARATMACHRDIPYGPRADEKLDIFPTGAAAAPVAAFIHGGAWTQLSKDESAYPAQTFVDAGITFVAVNFGLLPAITLEEQVRETQAAIAWLYQNARSFGADPDRLYVVGHSSGAHITGMLVTTDWLGTFGLPQRIIKGAAALSGLYDLEPVRLSARNGYLHLDSRGARRNSPIHRIRDDGCPLVIAYGGRELDEFQRQSRAFAAAWRARGLICEEIRFADNNHFDMTFEWTRPEGPVLAALFSNHRRATTARTVLSKPKSAKLRE